MVKPPLAVHSTLTYFFFVYTAHRRFATRYIFFSMDIPLIFLTFGFIIATWWCLFLTA